MLDSQTLPSEERRPGEQFLSQLRTTQVDIESAWMCTFSHGRIVPIGGTVYAFRKLSLNHRHRLHRRLANARPVRVLEDLTR